MKDLTIVIPCLNDEAELNDTIHSIRQTTRGTRDIEIIVVDDCSNLALEVYDPDVRLIRNTHRAGAGACRHMGMEIANSRTVLLCDSHMRFVDDWYSEAMNCVEMRPDSLFCATMLGFDSDHPPHKTPKGIYHGAFLKLLDGKDVIEGKWAPAAQDDSELTCLMGACYFIPRDWYQKVGGLQHLRVWGCEEQMLSLKALLTGHSIRLMADVKIWHKFRTPKEKPPYQIEVWNIIYNKLFIMHTMFPPEDWPRFVEALSKLPDYEMARERIRQDWNLIVAERAKNRRIFTCDIRHVAERYGLKYV